MFTKSLGHFYGCLLNGYIFFLIALLEKMTNVADEIFKFIQIPTSQTLFFARTKIIYLNYVLNIADLIFLNSRVLI